MALEMQERTRSVEKQVDLSEKGKDAAGDPTVLDRRLFMQLLAFGNCYDPQPLAVTLENVGLTAVLYADVNDPHGVGLLTFSEDPAYFVDAVRPLINREPFKSLTPKLAYSMLGRTYSIGYERDLAYVLLRKPAERVTNPELQWAIWYPLRRSGAFEQLSTEEQTVVLKEHGGIGRAYAGSEHALDIRLACHGLDTNDNDFITGLVGKELAPLSKLVQRMRKTKQTSTYLERLGPFFVGKVIWQAKIDNE